MTGDGVSTFIPQCVGQRTTAGYTFSDDDDLRDGGCG